MQPSRRLQVKNVRCVPMAMFLGASLFATSSAVAAPDNLDDADLTADSHVERSGPVNILPEAISARVNGERVTATTWGGYDGGERSPLLSILVEARVVGRLVFLTGVGYTAQMPGSTGVRPQIGLRFQALDQARHGVDLGAAVIYRQDQFTGEGGFIEGTVAMERRFGRLLLVGNLLYGQDGEGDDRDGQARVAALFAPGSGFLVGVDGRYRHALWSSDPRGPASSRPVAELVAGPTASFTHGSWMVMAETGFSSVSIPARHSGLIALAGFGSSF